MTSHNPGPNAEESMRSILGQIDNEFEVIVVDSLSTDASPGVLRRLGAEGRLRLIEKKCTIGKGLQTALENASGEYVLSGLDMGDIYRPRLVSFIDFYHRRCEGKLLKTRNEAVILAPRALLDRIGGWRDLQRSEGWDLWSRAAKEGSYIWTIFVLTENRTRGSFQAEIEAHPERKSFAGKYRHRYQTYRDYLRVGRKLFEPGSHVGLGQRLTQVLAQATLPFYSTYESGSSDFQPYEPKYFIDSRDWWLEEAKRAGDNLERERHYYRNELGGSAEQP